MKHKIYISLFVALISLASCANSDTHTHWLNLKGDVSSVKAIYFEADAKFGEVIKGDIDDLGIYLSNFDEHGMIKDRSFYDSYGNLERKEIYICDKNHQLTELNEYDYDGDLNLKSTWEYKDNFLLMYSLYNSDGELKFQEKCDNDGQHITRRGVTYSKYSLGNYSIFKYNGDELIEVILYNKEGDKEYSITYIDGRINRVIKPDYTTEFIYNKNGDIVRSINTEMILQVNSYHQDDVGQVFYYEYEYDSKDNWIKKIVYKGVNKTPKLIVERSIEYF